MLLLDWEVWKWGLGLFGMVWGGREIDVVRKVGEIEGLE